MKEKVDFIGVGFPKAGTTMLSNVLGSIPGVYIPYEKETCFFSKLGNQLVKKNQSIFIDQYETYGFSFYLDRYFSASKETDICGEFSTRYINDKEALERIKKHLPKVKIIVNIRHPIERFVSEYHHVKYLSGDGSYRSMDHYWTQNKLYYTGISYNRCISTLLDIFGEDQIYFFVLEKYLQNPDEELQKLLKFLGITCQSLFHNVQKNHRRKIKYARINTILVSIHNIGTFLKHHSILGRFIRKYNLDVPILYLLRSIKMKNVTDVDREVLQNALHTELSSFFREDIEYLSQRYVYE